MKRFLWLCILWAAPALAHAPYDDNKFSGAGASGEWDPSHNRVWYVSPSGIGTECTIKRPCGFRTVGSSIDPQPGDIISFKSGTYK